MTGVIPRRKIGEIYVRSENNLSDDMFSDVRKHIARQLALVKKKLQSVNPILYPPGKLPIAAHEYRPMLMSGKQAEGAIQPGRLRKATSYGMTWTGGSGLRGISPTGRKKSVITWGLGVKEFGYFGNYLPYGKWVAEKMGSATGGGVRFRWDKTFRNWLAKIIKTIIIKTNTKFKLEGNNRFFFRKGVAL